MPKIKHMCGPGRERWGQEAEKEMEGRLWLEFSMKVGVVLLSSL